MTGIDLNRVTDFLRYAKPLIAFSTWQIAVVLLVAFFAALVGQWRERRRILDHLPYESTQLVMKLRANVTVWKERYKTEKRRRVDVESDNQGLRRMLRMSAKQARKAIAKVEMDVGSLRAIALEPGEEENNE